MPSDIPDPVPSTTPRKGRRRGFIARNVALASIATEIAEREYPTSLRGLFYRVASAGRLPGTETKHYRRLGSIVATLRESGKLPWLWIIDSLRQSLKPTSWSGLEDYAETVARQYRKDFWRDQPECVEIFVEKDAIAGTLWPVSLQFDVRLHVCRGFSSLSFVHGIAQEWAQIKKPIHAYYIGDWDPSGMMIEKDLKAKLSRYSGRSFAWKRLAVVESDFEAFDLLPLPVKQKDTRSRAFVKEHGTQCAECDAIPSTELRRRLSEAIESHIDQAAWDRLQLVEAAERKTLALFSSNLFRNRSSQENQSGREDDHAK